MANNNVQNVKFLRNGSLYATRDAARTALEDNKNLGADGSAILARYSGGTSGEASFFIKTLVGFIYSDGTNSYVTTFDVDDAGTDAKNYVDSLLGTEFITSGNTVEDNLKALSGTNADTSGTTSVAGAKKYADGLKEAMDYTGLTSDENKAVYNVTEADGIVAASAKNVTEFKLAGYTVGGDDSGKVASSDTLGAALGKLQGQINGMDLAVVSGDGEVITAVSEADGKVSASKTAIKDVKLTGYQKTSATGDIAATDDIEDALSKLENKAAAITIGNADGSINVTTATTGTDINVNIKSGEKVLAKDGDAGLYTDIKLSAVTPSSTTVKEEYSLIATDGSVLGTNIKIYKDSSVVSIKYITDSGDTHYQNLEYTYIDVSGNTETEYVDMSSLVLEAEFASGITITDHVAHGVVDPSSEKDESNVAFLTVDAAGFKISGIKDAIDTKINKLDADLSGNSTHVTVGVQEVDGKITGVTVSESNVANADDLATLSGKTLTNVTSANSSITPTITTHTDGTKTVDLVTDASKVKMTGFTSDASGFTAITTASTVTEAVKAIETSFIENEEIVSSSLNDLNARINELSGGSASDLADEIAERRAIEGQSGSTYAANSGKRYISAATNMNAADVALNDALVTVADNYVSGATMNGSAVTKSGNTLQFALTAGSTASNDANAIHVDTNTSTGAITLTLGTIDCGTY